MFFRQSTSINRLGTVLVIVSVLALLITPVVMERRLRALRESISQLAEPVRTGAAAIQLALAIQAASLRGFVITGSPVMLEEYRSAREAGERAAAVVTQQARQLGQVVESEATWTSRASGRWNSRSEDLVSGGLSKEEFVSKLGEQQQLYREALYASERLQKAISAFQSEKRSAIQRLERLGVVMLVGLTVLASASAGITLYMNRRMRLLSVVATTDPLTGLLNRRGFVESATDLLASSKDTLVNLVYIDVDDFKKVNDVHGHVAGDEVLKKVGNHAKAAIRQDDLAARLGGDEFVLLLQDQGGPSESRRIVERIVESVRTALSTGAVPASISVGAVTGRAEHELSKLIQAGDGTMYEVKQNGKGTVLWRELT